MKTISNSKQKQHTNIILTCYTVDIKVIITTQDIILEDF